MIATKAGRLAVHGGPKAVTKAPGDLFTWPIVTSEDEEAVLEVLRRGAMSGSDVTLKFEAEMAAFHGVPYALGYCNGTASILGGLWACGVGTGDEVIAPSLTYWASVMPAFSLGATVVFADVDATSLCIDPRDIEHRITPRTKVIVAVHVYGHPCDMDAILAVARRHGIKVLEDVSHAQGGLYKGRMLGTLGDVGCMSLMSGKSFPIGEAGMLVTKDQYLWERATAFGFYERTGAARFGTVDVKMTDPGLKRFAGIPLGGCKHRMNQTCSAMGRVQLAHYPARIAEIQKAMDLFWGYLDGVPGIRPHRADASQGSTMGGRYCPVGHYLPEDLGGLSLETFVRALAAEGVPCGGAPNAPLHLHPFFHEADVYNHGKPTVIANAARDVRQGPGSLPVTEAAPGRVLQVPWFKHAREEYIREYADAVRKVIGDADALR